MWVATFRSTALSYHWSLKAEWHFIEGTSRLFNEFGQNPELPEKTWDLIALKSIFFF